MIEPEDTGQMINAGRHQTFDTTQKVARVLL
jgi:hypothetical protein